MKTYAAAIKSQVSPLARRKALARRARRNLPELVYRTLRLENEPVTRPEVRRIVAKVGRGGRKVA